jgi:hypothetical protein
MLNSFTRPVVLAYASPALPFERIEVCMSVFLQFDSLCFDIRFLKCFAFASAWSLLAGEAALRLALPAKFDFASAWDARW